MNQLKTIDLLQAAVGDGDAEDVAAQVIQHLAAAAGRLTIDHPVFLPHVPRRLVKPMCLVQRGAQFGAENDGEGRFRRQILGVRPPAAERQAVGQHERSPHG